MSDVPTCPETGKLAYPSERSAKTALRQVKRHRRDGAGFIHAYRCGSHWHLGHGHKSTPTVPGRKFR